MKEKKKEEKKKEIDVKTKRKKAKIAVVSLCAIFIIFIGLQVYASTNGYGNIFFMIKELITTGTLSGEEEIFSDKDITLSYKSIELAEGLKIQANRLEIKDGKTNLYLSIKSQDGEVLPLKYVVSTSNNGETSITGTKPQDTDNFSYEDILSLNYEVDENATITLKVNDSSNNELKTIEIDLATREITVKGESSVEKISKIELRKYLNMFSELNNDIDKNDILLYIAQELQDNSSDFVDEEYYEQSKKMLTDRGLKDAIIREFYGDGAEFEVVHNSYSYGGKGTDLEVLKLSDNNASWSYDEENDSYIEMTDSSDYRHGYCLEIEDISYEDGIYTIKYVYVLATLSEEDDGTIEELPQYETTIKLKRDNDQIYSKYQVVSIEEGTVIQNKVDTVINEEDDDEIIISDDNDIQYDYNLGDESENNSDESLLDDDSNENNGYVDISRSTDEAMGALKAYIVEANNSGEVFTTSFIQHKNGKEVDRIEETSTTILRLFISKINESVVNIDETTTYTEYCNREHYIPDEEYVIMFMYDGHQTQIVCDTKYKNQIIVCRYDKEKSDAVISKIELNEEAVPLMRKFYEDYKNGTW